MEYGFRWELSDWRYGDRSVSGKALDIPIRHAKRNPLYLKSFKCSIEIEARHGRLVRFVSACLAQHEPERTENKVRQNAFFLLLGLRIDTFLLGGHRHAEGECPLT